MLLPLLRLPLRPAAAAAGSGDFLISPAGQRMKLPALSDRLGAHDGS